MRECQEKPEKRLEQGMLMECWLSNTETEYNLKRLIWTPRKQDGTINFLSDHSEGERNTLYFDAPEGFRHWRYFGNSMEMEAQTSE